MFPPALEELIHGADDSSISDYLKGLSSQHYFENYGPKHDDKLRKLELSVSTVAAGSKCAAVVTAEGALWTWGRGKDKVLGHGSFRDECGPRRVEALEGISVVAVSLGTSHAAAISNAGQLFTWGYSDLSALGYHSETEFQGTPQLVPSLENVLQVSCGFSHTAAITARGWLYTWGHSPEGALGLGVASCAEPRVVSAFGDSPVVSVSCSCMFSAAVLPNGDLFTWGLGRRGQLGHGTEKSESLPRLVEALSGHQRVVAVSTGETSTMALTSLGVVYQCGDQWGGLSSPEMRPVTFDGDPQSIGKQSCVVGIASGVSHHAAVIMDAGSDEMVLATWGKPMAVGLGHQPTHLQDGGTPEEEPELRDDGSPRRLLLFEHKGGVQAAD